MRLTLAHVKDFRRNFFKTDLTLRAVRNRLSALVLGGAVFFLRVNEGRAAGTLPGFPIRLESPIEKSPLVVDLLGNGEQVVLAVGGSELHAFGISGKPVHGFPIQLGAKDVAAGDLAAADMDGDRHPEVAVTTASGKLFLISNGALLSKFPIKLEKGCAGGPSFADLDGDGKPELLQGDKSGKIHAFKKNGAELPGFPLQLPSFPTSSVSVGRLKGETALAVGTDSGAVYVFNAHGKMLSGFPLTTHAVVSAAPAFGDIDDDGVVDLVVGSQDFKLYAVNENGTSLEGFPIVTGLSIRGSPALADIDDDGSLDVAFGSADGMLYVVNGKGQALPGFPKELAQTLMTGVAVGDLDRDGKLDLVVGSSDGKVFAVNHLGKTLPGFPEALTGNITATPFIAAMGRDGIPVIWVGDPDSMLEAIAVEGKGKMVSAASSIPWASAGRDATRGGWYYPQSPRYKEVSVLPAAPRVDDPLKAHWAYFAVSGQTEPQVAISWFRNDSQVSELEGKREVPAHFAKKNEKWRFEFRAGPRSTKSPAVTVQDTAPTAPEIRISPSSPTRLTGGKFEVIKPSTDPDGDKLTYRIQWLLNGVPSEFRGEALPAAQLRKGQRWSLGVSAFDGTLESPTTWSEATVANAPPTAVTVGLSPKVPRRGEPIKASLLKQASDSDGDSLVPHFRWRVNGELKNYPVTLDTFPASAAKKGDRIKVEATAFDGESEGPPTSAEVQVVNTAPPAPGVAIRPDNPRTGQLLEATVTAPSLDADADAVTYRAVWTKNGKPSQPPGGDAKKGERWSVKMVPNDGTVEGAAGSAETTIVNTEPTSPLLGLKPEHPRIDTPIELEILRPSTDLDGDTVTYAFDWQRDGQSIGGIKTRKKLSPGEFKKHQVIRLTAAPSDGKSVGTSAAVQVSVDNTPPGSPVVTFSPSVPTAENALKAIIQKDAPDADHDPIVYRYTWTRNGIRQSFPETQAELPRSEIKKGDHWTLAVRAFDGEALGPVVSTSTTVGNVAPPPPTVVLVPSEVRKGQVLKAVLTEAADLDSDSLSYRFLWKRDGKPVLLPKDAASVPRGESISPKKGELWSVEVVASDGEAESKAAHAEIKIVNTVPTAPVVSLCGHAVRIGTSLELKMEKPSTDSDGDPISYDYSWTVNGKGKPAWAGKKNVGGHEFHRGELIRVAVTPSDGGAKGPAGIAECTVENTPPEPAEIVLLPAEPTAGSGVQLKIAKAGTDADGDAVSYHPHWFKEGVPFDPGTDGYSLKPGAIKRDEVVRVSVTSFDGQVEGGEISASVKVRNTPPAVPQVRIMPPKPKVTDAIDCVVTAPPQDADQDTVHIHYLWLRKGEVTPVGLGQPRLPKGAYQKNDSWQCKVWADDGIAQSAPALADVVVENSTPGAPEVSLEPEHPKTNDVLTCRVAREAADADGDLLTYHYQWSRNGKPSDPKDAAQVPTGMTHKGDHWKCAVTASDGTATGIGASAEKTIVNTAPGAAHVRLIPETPKFKEPLTCETVTPAQDPDGDLLSYRYTWLKDGVSQPFAPTSVQVPGRLVRHSDIWSCQVTPNDGQADGPTTSSAISTVP